MNLSQYVQNLNTRYITGISRELSYRADLQYLLSALLPDVLVTNEPARMVECGKPDYVLTKKGIAVGYIEAKDIGVNLENKSLKEQFDRYLSLPNIIFTDYISFHFYKDRNFVTKVAIAEIQNSKIVALPDNFEAFIGLIKNFADTITQSIKSPTKLAEMMAGRAKMVANVIEDALNIDDGNKNNSALKAQMLTFKSLLIHDISNRAFADLYAQTIAYGMFAARYHDPTLPTFSRQEAAMLIPKTNPFLRRLFQDIAGYDLDDRLIWIVDELVQVFLASDVAEIMRNFGTRTKQEDPVIHFYETFLAAYDPDLRKARGVWYTPEPVVKFIVRAVDDILKKEFGLPQGLADTSKTKITTKVLTKTTADARSKAKEVDYIREVHKVQILDPATGTGTFLAEVVRQIHQKFEGQKGIWSNYVENNLIPRLNGFEILMASYAMAHLKLDLLLTETGFKPTKDQRFRVYLTNSLEESHPDAGNLFSGWLSDEANEANNVKKDAPVMVVLGNPPYSVSSINKSNWIKNLIAVYKKDLNEKKLNLDDDYIKFIRFGEYLINKNEEGILAYISNNSFIDGVTHRQMRKSLLESFDKIYILDLHGSTMKSETDKDGKKDENVFDIMQGVSINIFIRTNKKKSDSLGEVFHCDFYGVRESKYSRLNSSNLIDLEWKKILANSPYYFFVPKDFSSELVYTEGFAINELFLEFGNGIGTDRDTLFYSFSSSELQNRFEFFYSNDCFNNQFVEKFNIKDSSSYNLLSKRKNTKFDAGHIKKSLYRPFDQRFFYHNPQLISRPANEIMANFKLENLSLLVTRQISTSFFRHVFISNTICDRDPLSIATKERTQVFPLYTISNNLLNSVPRTPNFNIKIVEFLAQKIDLSFTSEKETDMGTFAPIDILDYIYAVLHSHTYRETYKEFLKIDFPRVPYPKDAATFRALVALGSELRQVHLLESPAVAKNVAQYPEDGDNVVKKIRYEAGNVYINETQYFANVPPIAWEFYIGGYQPAQKWLKDRRDRQLGFEDVAHYRRIVAALVETDRLMKDVDKVGVL
jgi:predicted helicase